jgi:hypothetical protein
MLYIKYLNTIWSTCRQRNFGAAAGNWQRNSVARPLACVFLIKMHFIIDFIAPHRYMGASPPSARGAAVFGLAHRVAGVTVNALIGFGQGRGPGTCRMDHATTCRRRRIGGLRPGQPAQRGPERAGAAARSGRLGPRSVDQHHARLGPDAAPDLCGPSEDRLVGVDSSALVRRQFKTPVIRSNQPSRNARL